MNIILLKGFNNYFNRIIKKFDNYTDYTASYTYKILTNIDFDPADGIDTTQIFNWSETWTPDYILCVDSNNNIISRWFIKEWKRTRGKQYNATLHRDVIADHLNDIKEAPMFIEKGSVNSEDSAIFNKEDMTTNQIKSDEFLLKDETQCGWVVGYVAKTREDGSALVTGAWSNVTVTNAEASDSKVSESYDTFEEFYEAHPGFGNGFDILNYIDYSVQLDVCYGNLFSTWDTGITCTISQEGRVSWIDSGFNENRYLHGRNGSVGYWDRWLWKSWIHDARQKAAESLLSNYNLSVRESLKNELASMLNANFVNKNDATFKKYLAYVKTEPVVKIGTNYYKITNKADNTVTDFSYSTIGSTAFNLFNDNLNREPTGIQGHDIISGDAGPETYKASYSYQHHELSFVQIFPTCKIKNIGTPSVLQDAPYHMFCIPYSDTLTLYSGNNVHCYHTSKSVAIAAAQNLATQAGQGAVYDVQVLPYCPVRDIIKTQYISGENIQNYLSPGGTYNNVIVPGHSTPVKN